MGKVVLVKKILIIVVLSLIICSCNKLINNNGDNIEIIYEPVFRVKKDGVTLYIDIESNIIDGLNKYNIFTDFSEGLAVYKDKTFGYIDSKGNVIIENIFDHAEKFCENYAVVAQKVNNKKRFGYIKMNGKYLIKPQYESAFEFHNGIAHVVIENYDYYITTKGEIIHDFMLEEASDFSEGVAIIKKDGRYYIMDTEGELIPCPDAENITSFYDGYARIDVGKYDTKSGYINKIGKIIIKPQYVWAAVFSEGFAPVKESNDIQRDAYYINKKGEKVFDKKFFAADVFSEGLAVVISSIEDGHSNYSVINTKGEILFNLPEYVTGAYSYKDGLLKIYERDYKTETDKVGYVNRDGKVIWKPTD